MRFYPSLVLNEWNGAPINRFQVNLTFLACFVLEFYGLHPKLLNCTTHLKKKKNIYIYIIKKKNVLLKNSSVHIKPPLNSSITQTYTFGIATKYNPLPTSWFNW